ncbi:GNAT family N-acetyltransferase [Hyphomonas sp.]|uniref:GNAT family N-acetyltransferase n=1 Tax=Hyphomonas sp. TaxID=87 RepID=UPI000C563952|nr:GNAT family N-acetyltransferase [Hyphomonas sp.]MAB10146.1 GNAT family N-acetyltransferase [Hyphomonas sp.]MAU68240.1 GNAT family N-acetyltransferase [Hyphomonas sp.]MBM57910.1 GNAT family N-acetyltransferase [Hyphomonas sp.]|tara:strand:+ start:238 stop:525 length:288 start_codon:yes stop_codon:yes gene_type:complete
MESFDIRKEDGETGGRYVTVVDGHKAEMTYSKAGTSRIIIDHTGVPKALGGRGVGVALVQRAVEDARAAGLKIIPLCPFAKAQIEKHKEWQDVLA